MVLKKITTTFAIFMCYCNFTAKTKKKKNDNTICISFVFTQNSILGHNNPNNNNNPGGTVSSNVFAEHHDIYQFFNEPRLQTKHYVCVLSTIVTLLPALQ